MALNRGEDSGRVGRFVRLDNHTVDGRDTAVVEIAQQPLQSVGKRPAHRAADATRTERDETVLGFLHQRTLQRHNAEIVEDDRGIGERRRLDQPVDQRCLAGPARARDDRDRDGLLGRPRHEYHILRQRARHIRQ